MTTFSTTLACHLSRNSNRNSRFTRTSSSKAIVIANNRHCSRRLQSPKMVTIIYYSFLILLARVDIHKCGGQAESYRKVIGKVQQTNNHVLPTLLSVVDENNQYFVNVLQNDLYEEMLSPHVQYVNATKNGALRSQRSVLSLSKTEISFHEPVSVSWDETMVSDSDILAMYCPASETNPRQFQDAATIYQAKLTSSRSAKTSSSTVNTWYIDSFPILREETCEFRLYTRTIASDSNSFSLWNLKQPTSLANKRSLLSSSQIYYQQIAKSNTIFIKSTLKPTAIHLALGEDISEMRLHFVTGHGCIHRIGNTVGTGCLVIPLVLYYPTSSDALLDRKITVGTTTSYTASDMCSEPANITAPGKFRSPGLLHVVTMDDLHPDTKYTYQPGVVVLLNGDDMLYKSIDDIVRLVLSNDELSIWSDKRFSFKSSPLTHHPHAPFSFLVYGDQGCPATGWTMGAKKVAKRMEREFLSFSSTLKPEVRAIHHFGDLAYARGAAHIYDFWFHMIQPLASKVPLMIGIGNHEYDHYTGGEHGKDPSGETSGGGFRPNWNNFGNDSGGECGVPISKRFIMPTSGKSNGVFWYSFDFSSSHTIMLSSEHDLSPFSRQYQWLESDLQSLDRTKTPWVIVEIHRPLYNSFDLPDGQNLVTLALREQFEQLLMKYSVDLVFSGHYHSYLRTCNGLYRGVCNNGGPAYITVGTAGADLTNATLLEQNWTAASLIEWGYGKVTIFNASTLYFEFIADDEVGTVKDYVWINK